ncbi:MAG TPA: hypothetical protein VLW25_07495 [Bryobacteraceae bacterium]|nr:hypothetical protein [Bryobacteraceae bacterium]
MQKRLLLITGLAVLTTLQGADPKSRSGNDAAAAFARLKTLAGEWEANTPGGKARLSYELTGGGTALVERENAESEPGMMTVYHLDGGRVILTHYCMAGNQPRMQTAGMDPQTGEIQFHFLDVTNLSSPRAAHMHNVMLRIIDNNHVDSEWQLYENGAPKMTEKAHYTRVR